MQYAYSVCLTTITNLWVTDQVPDRNFPDPNPKKKLRFGSDVDLILTAYFNLLKTFLGFSWSNFQNYL